MKMKYLTLTIAVMALSVMFMVSLTYAQIQNSVNIYSWTDKTCYNPGESGVLHIVIRNDRTDEDLILKNITIIYPWFCYTGEKWEGNDTIKIEAVITKKGGVYTNDVAFEVPSDGKAAAGTYGSTPQIHMIVTVDKSPYTYTKDIMISIKGTPLYMAVEDMDNFITLFTIQTVLVIVCTIIVAATIFLSARRPQVTWKHEEK